LETEPLGLPFQTTNLQYMNLGIVELGAAIDEVDAEAEDAVYQPG